MMKIMRSFNRRQILGLVVLFIVTFSLGAFFTGSFSSLFQLSLGEKINKGEKINILVMGIDARENEVQSRSDTMVLASIDFQEAKAALLWIPRDTRVQTATGRNVKINSFNFTHGPEEACKQVGKLLNTRVDHYVVIDFQGFAKIIDTLGGVHIDVETSMIHPDPDPLLRINLSRGYQLLNGKEALDYVRYRGGPTADIGRTQRQQKFIQALAEQVMKPQTILKLPQLIPEWKNSVHTNMEINEILQMAGYSRDFDRENIVTQTLPGYSYTDPSSGASYWEVDRQLAGTIIPDLLGGKTYEVAQDPPSGGRRTQTGTPVSGETAAQPPEEAAEAEEQPELEHPLDIPWEMSPEIETGEIEATPPEPSPAEQQQPEPAPSPGEVSNGPARESSETMPEQNTE